MIIHGVALSIYEHGVLITGEAYSGKSELALSMLDRGHQLIADDAVQLQLNNPNLYLQAVDKTEGLLHLRDIGIINIRQLFGPKALKTNQKLDLIVTIANSTAINSTITKPQFNKISFHGQPIYQTTLASKHEANCALKLETLVKLYKLLNLEIRNNHAQQKINSD